MGYLILDDIAHIDDDIHKKHKATEINEDDVLLNITGASIGRTAIATKEIEGGNVNQHVCIIRANSKVSPKFLCNYIQTKKIQNYIQSLQTGGSREGLNFEQIRSFPISLPGIAEQSQIAQLLDKLNERIATQNKIIDKLQSLIKGICNQLLYANNGISVRLGDILIERSERTKENNQHEVLSSTVKGIFTQREYFSKDIASENNVGYKVVRLHDVVLSPQNLWMGNINYNNKFDIGIVSPSYKVFSIAVGYDKEYIAALLKTHRALYNYMLVSEQGASIVRRNLNMEEFEQLTFKLPPIERQERIGHTISKLKLRLAFAYNQKTMYEKQKQYLLRQMFI